MGGHTSRRLKDLVRRNSGALCRKKTCPTDQPDWSVLVAERRGGHGGAERAAEAESSRPAHGHGSHSEMGRLQQRFLRHHQEQRCACMRGSLNP